jgi:hypothetical protein
MPTMKPTFVCGLPKSGTTLLLSLLEGHPSLLAFPEQCNYHAFPVGGIVHHDDILKSLFKPDKLQRFQNVTLEGDLIKPDLKDYSRFSYDAFSKAATRAFLARSPTTNPERQGALALESLVAGFADAVGGGASYERFVVKKPRYEFGLERIFGDFPAGKVIYLLRDPIEMALSRSVKDEKRSRLRVGKATKGLTVGQPNAAYLYEWDASTRAASRWGPDQILMVRYESLTQDPERTMREVAEFLDIPWNAALLEPTFFGQSWGGNSMQDKRFSGVARNPRRAVAPDVVARAEGILGTNPFWPLYYDSGSKAPLSLTALALPLPGEGLRTPLNRLSLIAQRARRGREPSDRSPLQSIRMI